MVHNGSLYSLGSEEARGTVYRFSNRDWILHSDNTPSSGVSLFALNAVSHGGRAYIMGGNDGSTFKRDIWVSSDLKEWAHAGSLPEAAGAGGAVASFNDSLIYVYGGKVYSGVVSTVGGSVNVAFGAGVAVGVGDEGGQAVAVVGSSHARRLLVMGGIGNDNLWSSSDGRDWSVVTATILSKESLTPFGAGQAYGDFIVERTTIFTPPYQVVLLNLPRRLSVAVSAVLGGLVTVTASGGLGGGLGDYIYSLKDSDVGTINASNGRISLTTSALPHRRIYLLTVMVSSTGKGALPSEEHVIELHVADALSLAVNFVTAEQPSDSSEGIYTVSATRGGVKTYNVAAVSQPTFSNKVAVGSADGVVRLSEFLPPSVTVSVYIRVSDDILSPAQTLTLALVNPNLDAGIQKVYSVLERNELASNELASNVVALVTLGEGAKLLSATLLPSDQSEWTISEGLLYLSKSVTVGSYTATMSLSGTQGDDLQERHVIHRYVVDVWQQTLYFFHNAYTVSRSVDRGVNWTSHSSPVLYTDSTGVAYYQNSVWAVFLESTYTSADGINWQTVGDGKNPEFNDGGLVADRNLVVQNGTLYLLSRGIDPTNRMVHRYNGNSWVFHADNTPVVYGISNLLSHDGLVYIVGAKKDNLGRGRDFSRNIWVSSDLKEWVHAGLLPEEVPVLGPVVVFQNSIVHAAYAEIHSGAISTLGVGSSPQVTVEFKEGISTVLPVDNIYFPIGVIGFNRELLLIVDRDDDDKLKTSSGGDFWNDVKTKVNGKEDLKPFKERARAGYFLATERD